MSRCCSIFQNDVESVDDTRDITQDCEEDVDQEISSATSLEEDTNWWEDDGKKDLADIACGERHVDGVFGCVDLKSFCGS